MWSAVNTFFVVVYNQNTPLMFCRLGVGLFRRLLLKRTDDRG